MHSSREPAPRWLVRPYRRLPATAPATACSAGWPASAASWTCNWTS